MQHTVANISHKAIIKQSPTYYKQTTMRFALASALLMAASAAAADDVISLLKRNYYAYGYKDGTSSGVPDG